MSVQRGNANVTGASRWVRPAEDYGFQLAEAVGWLDALDVELLALDDADHLLALSGRVRQRLMLALVDKAA